MTWRDLKISPDGSCHLREGRPAYTERFDEVLAFHAPGLAPVCRAGDAWHVHPTGQAAYARRFLRTFGFYEGIAAAIHGDGWGHIDPTGADIYPQRYAWCGNFQGGRCTVRLEGGDYLHISPDGRPAYPNRWRYAGDFRDGIAVVQVDNGRSTHIDTEGRLVHGRWFLDLDVFHKGFARARDERGWLHVDRGGQPCYVGRFAAVEPFYNGQARVERPDGGLEVINEAGQTLVELRPASRSEFAALSADMVGFWRTETIAAGVALGVFEALPGTLDQVAKRCELPADKAQRLLRGLAELELVERDGAGAWRRTGRGDYLQISHPLTLADAAIEYARRFIDMWRELPQALRRTDERHPDLFGTVAADSERCEPHHRMLLSYARHDYADVPAALGLQGSEHIVDAGGGLGALCAALRNTYPDLRITLLDRREVIEQAQRMNPLELRIEWLADDLFAPWPVVADAVILARVLHDWDYADALCILRRAQAALRPGGRLFVIEMVLPEDGVSGALCDLHLLMATGGRERTDAEFQALLNEAGFDLGEVRSLSGLPSVIVSFRR